MPLKLSATGGQEKAFRRSLTSKDEPTPTANNGQGGKNQSGKGGFCRQATTTKQQF